MSDYKEPTSEWITLKALVQNYLTKCKKNKCCDKISDVIKYRNTYVHSVFMNI